VALVLLVDDEEGIRDLVRLNLELEGHGVAQAADGLEALRAVAGGLRPDLVILDVMMPELDGWETLSRLKADPHGPMANVPVLMLTARASDMDRIRGGIEGAVHYLTKPFGIDVLMRAVKDALATDEQEARRRAQRTALGRLAKLEKGEQIDLSEPEEVHAGGGAGRVRFSRLERQPSTSVPTQPVAAAVATIDLSQLSPKQVELLVAVGAHETVSDAALSLGVSRSNVYASLRRIARKLDIAAVPELVLMARRGDLRA
jgi:DNA-binding response OmpR family regulator/DNA-binding CsgD family transcriptional regulator